jgi:hypothetical protein
MLNKAFLVVGIVRNYTQMLVAGYFPDNSDGYRDWEERCILKTTAAVLAG